MGPVGYDIGCGMLSAKSDVPVDAATPEKRLEFNRAVMERVNMGAGGLGDGIQGLLAAAAVKASDPSARVVYRVGKAAIPFVSLFDVRTARGGSGTSVRISW